jgi:hypothetical protein
MMRTLRQIRNIGFLAGALVLASAASMHGQQPVDSPVVRRLVAQAPQVDSAPADLKSRTADLPDNWVDQLQEMTPAEQQRFLRNNARFRSLSPQQQALIRRRLRAWNSLPLEQREALLDRQQIWEQLPQEQRRQVRESLLPRWQNLPVPSRQRILTKLRELRGLDGAERNAKLSDDNFLEDMNSDERQMLIDLCNLGVGQTAG